MGKNQGQKNTSVIRIEKSYANDANMQIKAIIFIGAILLLIYTRFVNLGWGLPYPMHPDERNMVVALQQLSCKDFVHCFNPHFFAYGQFPLYLAYVGIWLWKLVSSNINAISFNEATMALRIISAIASLFNVYVLINIIKIITVIKKKDNFFLLIISLLIISFSPYAIQFAHFGTTESLLMLFYCLIIYFSLLLLKHKILNLKFIILNSIAMGLALATKVSAIWFIAVPIVAILFCNESKINKLKGLAAFLFLSFIIAIIFSPYNLIDWRGFLSSMGYESDVALGRYVAFYTRQFVDTIPIIFQSMKIFPYAFGWPIFILGLMGSFSLSWKNRNFNLLRLAFFVYFIPNAFVFAKWIRFMAPVMPIIALFAVLFLLKIKVIKIIKIIIIIISILPGIAYLSIYQNPDVRFQASKWIYQNIPEGSRILSETANVVDIPIIPYNNYKDYKNYKIMSFNFYDLDESLSLQYDLQKAVSEADYIFVPSRRIWANHYCETAVGSQQLAIRERNRCQLLKEKYPILNQYYDNLFSGKLGFKLVKEFESYPKITLFGKTIYKIPDEMAEETWSVFNHPVIRIYKKI